MQRIHAKLRQRLSNGEYYEAHQLYRTLYFRFGVFTSKYGYYFTFNPCYETWLTLDLMLIDNHKSHRYHKFHNSDICIDKPHTVERC